MFVQLWHTYLIHPKTIPFLADTSHVYTKFEPYFHMGRLQPLRITTRRHPPRFSPAMPSKETSGQLDIRDGAKLATSFSVRLPKMPPCHRHRNIASQASHGPNRDAECWFETALHLALGCEWSPAVFIWIYECIYIIIWYYIYMHN